MSSATRDLVIPVYLNTATLVDLMATIEDGISFVETVTTSSDSSETVGKVIKAGFQVNPFGIFQLGMGGHRGSESEESSGNQRISERSHTLGSMLNRLRTILMADGTIKTIEGDDEWENLRPSDFIEARGVFVPDQMRSQIQKLNRLFQLAKLGDAAGNNQTASNQPKNKRGHGPQVSSGDPNINNIQTFLKGLEDTLNEDGVQTYVVELPSIENHKIVTPLFDKHIRDSSNTELPHGTYRVFGQVTRILDANDSIDLLRGSAFAGLSDEILGTFIDAFQQMSDSGLKFDAFSTKVEYPAIQITPIAVYP